MMISDYFRLSEFESSDGQQMSVSVAKNVIEVAENLDVLRSTLNSKIIINSGYRSISHNKAVGGVKNSFHIKGMAADIRSDKYSPVDVYNSIETLISQRKMKQGGLGLYDTFVHYDIQGKKRRWDNRSVKEPISDQSGTFFFSCPCCSAKLEVSALTVSK